MSALILGDWTHRRGDAGGCRAVSARIERPRPRVAWVWEPPHQGRVEQVRIAGDHVYVASLPPIVHVGWEHARVSAFDARTGTCVAQRTLPDPVPISAMVLSRQALHIFGTRACESLFWYELDLVTLAPRARRRIHLKDLLVNDVYDAWLATSGVWLSVDTPLSTERNYLFLSEEGALQCAHQPKAQKEVREPCLQGDSLVVPFAATSDGGMSELLWLDGTGEVRASRQADDVDTGVRAAALCADGRTWSCWVQSVEPSTFAFDARAYDVDSGHVAVRVHEERIALRGVFGESLRMARRPNGELLVQSRTASGTPVSDLIVLSPNRSVDVLPLAGRRYTLDCALGDTVLVHHERTDGRVLVVGFEIDRTNRFLGRRAKMAWSFETSPLGGQSTVYAGAGRIFVRGLHRLCALTL